MLLECTCRIVQGRRLLRPSPYVNTIILGILGRALTLTPGVRIVDLSFPSSHYHIELLAEDEKALARFFNIVNSQLATRVGAQIHQWNSKTWSRRYRSIPILDEKKMVERVRYIYSQGLHHDLVDDPLDFPGVHSLRARLFGEPLFGKWFDGTAYGRAKRRKGGEHVKRDDFWIRYDIELAPLPCWAHLSEAEYRDQVQSLCVDIVLEHQARWKLEGTRPIGAEAMLAADPTSRPSKAPKTSPAPLCHASTKATRKAYGERVRAHRSEYDPASLAFREGELEVEFPSWSFRPLGPYVREGEPPSHSSDQPSVRIVAAPD